MPMGRPKKNATHLPQRMREKNGNYYYVSGQKWTPLGRDLAVAKLRWAELEGIGGTGLFDSALDRYLASPDFTELAENTRRSYMSTVPVLRRGMGKIRCSQIKPSHIYAYMDKMPSKSMANVGLNVIKGAMKHARRAGWVDVSPADSIDRHKMRERTRYLTDEELRAVYDHATPLLQAIVTLAYITGQRQVDILKIRLSDITDEGIFVMQQKTKKKQLFTWTDELRQAVEMARRLPRDVRGMTLFCTVNGGQYQGKHIASLWREACQRAGIDGAQFRDLRSKAGTDAVELGLDHQQLLGHASKAMSDRYVKRVFIERVEPLRKKI